MTHTRLWYLIDAQGQTPGRLASMLSPILQGKYKPVYHPSVDSGDHVVVINADVRSSCCLGGGRLELTSRAEGGFYGAQVGAESVHASHRVKHRLG